MNNFHTTAAMVDHHRAELHSHAQRTRLGRSARRRPNPFSRLATALLALW